MDTNKQSRWSKVKSGETGADRPISPQVYKEHTPIAEGICTYGYFTVVFSSVSPYQTAEQPTRLKYFYHFTQIKNPPDPGGSLLNLGES